VRVRSNASLVVKGISGGLATSFSGMGNTFSIKTNS